MAKQCWQIQEHVGTQDTSHIWQLDYVNLICGDTGFRRGNAALFHNPNQDVRKAVHGDDFLCLSDDDGLLKHIDSLLKSKYTAKDIGNTWIRRFRREKPSVLLNRVFRVGVDQTGQYLDIELDLRHAPLIISGSGCNTKHHSSGHTTRETTGQTGVRRKTESDSEER